MLSGCVRSHDSYNIAAISLHHSPFTIAYTSREDTSVANPLCIWCVFVLTECMLDTDVVRGKAIFRCECMCCCTELTWKPRVSGGLVVKVFQKKRRSSSSVSKSHQEFSLRATQKNNSLHFGVFTQLTRLKA